MSAGAGGNASVEGRWEVGWVCFESGKRGKCRRSLSKCRKKAGWGGVSRADTRGASGRGKRRSTEFVSLKCLWEGAGSNEGGSCEIGNKSDFCGSAGSALNELRLLCAVSPSCGTFSFYLCFVALLQQQRGLSVSHKITLFCFVEEWGAGIEAEATGRLRMGEVSGGSTSLTMDFGTHTTAFYFQRLAWGSVWLLPLGSALSPRPCKCSGFIYEFIPWMVLPGAAEDHVV